MIYVCMNLGVLHVVSAVSLLFSAKPRFEVQAQLQASENVRLQQQVRNLFEAGP